MDRLCKLYTGVYIVIVKHVLLGLTPQDARRLKRLASRLRLNQSEALRLAMRWYYALVFDEVFPGLVNPEALRNPTMQTEMDLAKERDA